MARGKRLPWWFWAGAAVGAAAFVYYVWQPKFLYDLGWKTYPVPEGGINPDVVNSLPVMVP
jgi:hypothetical protein